LYTTQKDEQSRLSDAEAQVRRWEREINCRQDEILAAQREITAVERSRKELGRKIGQLVKDLRRQAYFLLTAKQSLLNELGAIRDETKVPEHLQAMWRKHQKVLELN
jgi:predicted  nucleic acid-binding Zn-ribbon protein